jgi:hypothetical protein
VDGDIPLECGCPPPRPVLMAGNAPPKIVSGPDLPKTSIGPDSNSGPSTTNPESPTARTVRLTNGPETAPLPASQPNQVHVQVDAPFVFSAKDRAAKASKASAPSPETPLDLPVDESTERQVHLEPVIQPAPSPDPQNKTEHQGFFNRVGKFFSSIFH